MDSLPLMIQIAYVWIAVRLILPSLMKLQTDALKNAQNPISLMTQPILVCWIAQRVKITLLILIAEPALQNVPKQQTGNPGPRI